MLYPATLLEARNTADDTDILRKAIHYLEVS